MHKETRNNIVLIGMSGSGKSTAGVLVAKYLGYDFIDTDILIATKYKKPLSQILQDEGYNKFIELEGRIGENLVCNKCIIATGGSMIFSDKAMMNLKSSGKVIWLNVEYKEIEKRIENNILSRGIATEYPMSIKEICDKRKELYRKYADFTINCKGDLEETVKDIINVIKDKRC